MSSRLSASSTRRRRSSIRSRGLLVSTSLIVVAVLSGCSEETNEEMKRLGFPQGVSDRSHYIQDLWIGAWIAAGAVGVFVWGLIFWSSIRYRRRNPNQPAPPQVRYNLPIEMLYTVAPVIVILVLFFFTVKADDNVYRKVANPDHTITVTAQQWSWTFNYVNDKALDGTTDVWETGTPAKPPELWLAKGQTVNFTLHSPDVIHSFWVPAFLFKMDVIPGRENTFSLRPEKAGTFAGRCAELCGLEHSRMLFTVKIVSPSAYAQHLRDLQAKGNTGILLGGSDADTPAGLDTNQASD